MHYKVNGLYVSNVHSGLAETNQHPRRGVFAKAVDGFKHLTIFTSPLPLRRLIGSSNSMGVDV